MEAQVRCNPLSFGPTFSSDEVGQIQEVKQGLLSKVLGDSKSKGACYYRRVTRQLGVRNDG
jgi:hypothetical protein